MARYANACLFIIGYSLFNFAIKQNINSIWTIFLHYGRNKMLIKRKRTISSRCIAITRTFYCYFRSCLHRDRYSQNGLQQQ